MALNTERNPLNYRVKDCGCKLVRVGPTPMQPSHWYVSKPCDLHKDAS